MSALLHSDERSSVRGLQLGHGERDALKSLERFTAHLEGKLTYSKPRQVSLNDCMKLRELRQHFDSGFHIFCIDLVGVDACRQQSDDSPRVHLIIGRGKCLPGSSILRNSGELCQQLCFSSNIVKPGSPAFGIKPSSSVIPGALPAGDHEGHDKGDDAAARLHPSRGHGQDLFEVPHRRSALHQRRQRGRATAASQAQLRQSPTTEAAE